MPIRRTAAVVVAALSWFALARAARAEDAPPDQTLSPYFVVEGAAPGVDALPLESTHADVHIAGVIADVAVTQTYKNDGDRTISARYVFPASTRAAVYGMKMTIGDRVIVAKIKEKEAARAEYEQARREGKTASLLEEDRPNVFSMSVANILPKDRIQVELRYTELLVPTDGVYELVYPTTVGPRYASAKTDASSPDNQFVASPYTHAGQAPSYGFGIDVHLAAGMPIQAITSPSHHITTQLVADRTRATIGLGADEAAGGDRDFVLRYRLAGDRIQSGLLLDPAPTAGGESFFLMMVQPPHRPALAVIPPREYVFILDVSGSMGGFPLDTAKRLMRGLLSRMRPTDRFDVELFSGASELFAPASVPATPDEIAKAIAFVDGQRGGGGTELLPAIQTAMKLPRPRAGVSRSFVVVTDGYISEEPAVFDQIRDHLDEANVFSFGIGSSVNRHLMEGIAKAGQGEAFVVLGPDEADAAAERFRSYIESPVLTHVQVAFDGLDTYDVEPKTLPDVFAERPVIVFGKYRGTPAGKITLTGISGHGRFVRTLDVAATRPDPGNAALRYLWARARISDLSDFYNDTQNHDAVVALGLRYNLLTKFTSFIAVSQRVRATGPSVDVAQALPMPAGVADSAVGPEVGAEPPLPVVLALVALGLVLGAARRRRWV
jgi:Ca-activated chloride channel family protein